MTLRVREARKGDAESIAPRLRRADRQEVTACGTTPLEALRHGFEHSSPPHTIELVGGAPVAMFGVVPDSERSGRPWLLGTNDIAGHRRQFLVESRQVFAALRAPYEHLANWIDQRNDLHVRWIQWLGFSITGLNPAFGPERRPFLFFEWHRNV